MVSVQETIAAARQRRPFTILGVLIGLLVLASFIFVASGVHDTSGTTPAGSFHTVVAKNAIKARSLITRADLVEMDLGASTVQGFTKIGDVLPDAKSLKYALIDIPAGQPVTANAIATSPGDLAIATQPFLDIPAGYIAMTIPTSEQQGVAGSIRPGDYIGIIAVIDLGLGAGTVAKTVFSYVHVLQTGLFVDVQAARPANPVTSGSLTIIMTECDAEYLNWFLTRASLRYTLLSAKDYKTAVPASNCTIDQAKGVTNADIAARFGIK